jgi:hypothetical protein
MELSGRLWPPFGRSRIFGDGSIVSDGTTVRVSILNIVTTVVESAQQQTKLMQMKNQKWF